MPRNPCPRLATAVIALLLASAVPAAAPEPGGTPAHPVDAGASTAAAFFDTAGFNWAAPQFYDPKPGFSTNLPGLGAAGFSSKNELAVSTFVPITPCRLVDTRGVFSPVYAGGAYTAGQTRVYRASGNCGVPAGASRIRAVSLAVTTPPTAASGDIEVLSEAAALGNTVVMVIQAGQWNSATTVSAVDNDGDFKVQLRGTSGHVVIDINGYYAGANEVTASYDYVSITGAFAATGGVLFVRNSSTLGAAINAYNSGGGGNVMLADGKRAVNISSGSLAVEDSGVQTRQTTAMVHKVNTSNSFGTGNGTLCPGFPSYTVVDNIFANGNPRAILIVTPVEYYDSGTVNVTSFGAYPVAAFYAPGGTCLGTGYWTLRRLDGTPHANGVGFNILVITQ